MIKQFFLLLCFLIPVTALFPDLRFEPEQLTFHPEQEVFEESVLVINDDERELVIQIVLSGEGWQVEPSTLKIAPGESGAFILRGRGYSKEDAAPLLMLSDREDVPYLYAVQPFETEVPSGPVSGDNPGVPEPFVFFYTPGCDICDHFYSSVLPELEDSLGVDLNPEKLNIYDAGNYERLEALSAERNMQVKDFPVLVAGSRIFGGEKELIQGFPSLLKNDPSVFNEELYSDGHDSDPVMPGLRWLPVFLAGLLDGINPCAFTSLIFLISYLRLMKKKGSEILVIGGSFTLAVFLTYFLIGLGAFRFIRMADSFTLVSDLIRYVLGGVLLVLSLLSLIDYVRVKQGRSSESLLQLSGGTKKRIHKVVRNSSRSSWIYVSSFAAGFLISVYELGCTGQIYLPMLVYMVKQEDWSALGPLVLYNLAFILPLIVVFTLFYKGSDSEQIGQFFADHLSLIKLAGGLLFLVMAVFILFF
ncbi:MAG: hypothetical protein PQJ58_19995 [Spirochaetales bacterium]|nr:hypothetical protein [Spirochaetales bacterium]